MATTEFVGQAIHVSNVVSETFFVYFADSRAWVRCLFRGINLLPHFVQIKEGKTYYVKNVVATAAEKWGDVGNDFQLHALLNVKLRFHTHIDVPLKHNNFTKLATVMSADKGETVGKIGKKTE